MIALSDLQPGLSSQLAPFPSYGVQVPPPTDMDGYAPPRQQLAATPLARSSQDEELIRQLTTEKGFVNAVRAGDVQGAAQTAWKFCKHHVVSLLRTVQDERESGALQLGWGGQADDAGAWTGGRRHVMETNAWQREIKVGDWVMIQGVKKSYDSELIGSHAQVQGVDEGGMVDLAIAKIGVSTRLHIRYLAPLHMSVAYGSARPHAPGGHHHHHHHPPRHREPSRRHQPHSSGYTGASSESDEGGDVPRSIRRQHTGGGASDNSSYVRPSTLGQPLPPAKVSTLLGRGVCKARDVAKGVRKELLSLEELVPWDCVDSGWRNRRASWQKSLRNVDLSKSVEGVVPVIAASVLEFHDALLVDKVSGMLAKGGTWETRSQELAAGGNNYQCLQQVWDELHDAVRTWLYSQGKLMAPPPPMSPLPLASAQQQQQQHHHHHQHHHALPPTPPAPPTPLTPLGPATARSFDKSTYPQVLKAVSALQSGVAVADQYLPLGQLAVDRVIALGRESSAALRTLLVSQDDVSLGPALEALALACDLPALLGVTPGELDKLSDADVVCLMLVSPAVRAELRVLHSVDSEPDTDVDMGSDATDMED